MIEKYIHENPAEPPKLRANASHAASHNGMRIGEGIDPTMLMDSAQKFR